MEDPDPAGPRAPSPVEMALRDSEERLRGTLQTAVEGVITIDERGVMESVYAERALRAGACGYIMKKEGGRRILEAIRKVRAGEVAVSEKMSAQILRIFSGCQGGDSESPVRHLTDREFEVFELIGRGLGTAQMAAELNISAKTVEVHRAHIKEKLNTNTAIELIAYAARWSQSAEDK